MGAVLNGKTAAPGAWEHKLPVQLLRLGAGLAAMVLGSDLQVQASLRFAKAMGVSDLVMLAVALTCLPVFITGREIARWEGALFLGDDAASMAYLVMAAQQHDALPAFSGVMPGFVVPLTVVTLVVVVRRPAAGHAP